MSREGDTKKPEQKISLKIGAAKPVEISAMDAAEIISLLAGAIADGRDCICEY